MCFVEPIVRLFAIRYSNMYVNLLFAKMILLDTIYSLKFLRICFYSIIGTLKYYIFLKSEIKHSHLLWKIMSNTQSVSI